MTMFVLFATFVHSMMRAKIGAIISLWYKHWAIDDDKEKLYDSDLTITESREFYQEIQFFSFFLGLVLVPIYGLFNDKIGTGLEVMFSFGLRCIACMSFFMLDNPHGRVVNWTFIAIKVSASLQSVMIDSLYYKRLPGDVRGSMIGIKSLVTNLGHLTWVAFSVICIEFYPTIYKSMVLVSLFDASVFFMVFILIIFAGFDLDQYFGKEAREKAKIHDAALKEEMR